MSAKTDASLHAANPTESDSFPILILDVRGGTSNPPRTGFKKMHWHDDLQFIVVSHGTVDVDASGEHFECPMGSGVFFNSRVPHRIVGNPDSEYMSFIFPSKLLGFFPGSDMAALAVAPYVGATSQPVAFLDGSASWHGDVLSHLRKARRTYLKDRESGLAKYRVTIQLATSWMFYIENVQQETPTRRMIQANERIKAFTTYIDEHFSEPISIADIAQTANVSKVECSRCFKEVLQTTPHAYLMDYRIDRATEMMRNGAGSTTSIALACGFGSSSHFSNAFRKALGMSPSDYLALIVSS